MGLFSSKVVLTETPDARVERLLGVLTRDVDTPGCFASLCPCRTDGYSAHRWGKYAYAVTVSTDLEPGRQAFLLELLIEMKYNEGVIAKNNRRHGMWLLMVQAVLQAMVPILIPIAQNMSSSEDEATNQAGGAIAYTAVAASLVGTVCMVIEKTRKYGAIGAELFKHQAAVLSLVESYVGMTDTNYEHFREKEGQGKGHGQNSCWHVFMEQYQSIRLNCDISRNNIYIGKSPESGNESSETGVRSRSEAFNEERRASKQSMKNFASTGGAPAGPPPVHREGVSRLSGTLRRSGQTDDSQVHPSQAAPLPQPNAQPGNVSIGRARNDDELARPMS